mmetsp:Transcript_38530/g.79032  ORF Transcript_38530/g.79032 Transcript_38530/m.79032 type:complete len:221 (+) Transcript_38530:731-1393(+)
MLVNSCCLFVDANEQWFFGCQSLVWATTSNTNCWRRALVACTASMAFGTCREPVIKSFWRSTTMSALRPPPMVGIHSFSDSNNSSSEIWLLRSLSINSRINSLSSLDISGGSDGSRKCNTSTTSVSNSCLSICPLPSASCFLNISDIFGLYWSMIGSKAVHSWDARRAARRCSCTCRIVSLTDPATRGKYCFCILQAPNTAAMHILKGHATIQITAEAAV